MLRRHPSTTAFARFALVQGIGGASGTPTPELQGDYFVTEQGDSLITDESDLLVAEKAPTE